MNVSFELVIHYFEGIREKQITFAIRKPPDLFNANKFRL